MTVSFTSLCRPGATAVTSSPDVGVMLNSNPEFDI